MRVVVDTNIFISAALQERSLPAVALHLVAAGATLLKSSETERQLFDVLARPRIAALVAPATLDWFRALLTRAEPVPIIGRIRACRDPTDDKFLDLAINGGADFIISGDADLLVLNPFRSIPIVGPARFVEAHAGRLWGGDH